MESCFTPGNPDKDLDERAARKVAKYRELYRDHRRHLDFLPAIASTSGRRGVDTASAGRAEVLTMRSGKRLRALNLCHLAALLLSLP